MPTPQHKSQPTMVSVTTRNTTETRPINLETYEKQDVMDLSIQCVIHLLTERKKMQIPGIAVGCIVFFQYESVKGSTHFSVFDILTKHSFLCWVLLAELSHARSEAPWVRKFGYPEIWVLAKSSIRTSLPPVHVSGCEMSYWLESPRHIQIVLTWHWTSM